MRSQSTDLIKECPKCKWHNKVLRGDNLHPDSATVKPKQSEVYEDIADMKETCINPDCNHNFTVYHFRKKPSKPVFLLR